MIKQFVLVFTGGGFGSALRYLISTHLNETQYNIPIGTFAVNVLGCFIIGLILGLSFKNENFSPATTLLIAIGFYGGFTTFSTFALENHTFLEGGQLLQFFA